MFVKITFCDLFFIMKDVDAVSFADDNTPYKSASNFTNLNENLGDSACLTLTQLKSKIANLKSY